MGQGNPVRMLRKNLGLFMKTVQKLHLILYVVGSIGFSRTPTFHWSLQQTSQMAVIPSCNYCFLSAWIDVLLLFNKCAGEGRVQEMIPFGS